MLDARIPNVQALCVVFSTTWAGAAGQRLEAALNAAVPESWNDEFFKHTYEGPDDMPGHVKSSLMVVPCKLQPVLQASCSDFRACNYDRVRQSVTEKKQKQKAWTNHKFGSNRSDPFRPKSELVIGPCFLLLLLLLTL